MSLCREFVSTFIQFPKPLIAAVNGPAVGVSVTLLALCDLVYAAENVRDVHVPSWLFILDHCNIAVIVSGSTHFCIVLEPLLLAMQIKQHHLVS